MKFKIGDIVKGNKAADIEYGVTTSDCTGEVINVYKDDILLKIISHELYGEEVGNEYIVNACCFDLVMPYTWTGLYGIANYRQLFSVENGVPVVNNVGKDSPCYKQLCDEYAKYMENMEKEKKV